MSNKTRVIVRQIAKEIFATENLRHDAFICAVKRKAELAMPSLLMIPMIIRRIAEQVLADHGSEE